VQPLTVPKGSDQTAYGAGLFRFTERQTIENWLPIFRFCVLFGPRVGCHVFLLARIREHDDATLVRSVHVPATMALFGRRN
jgi:uncharacterized membrane protein YdfJ with MMPL/SSD domain